MSLPRGSKHDDHEHDRQLSDGSVEITVLDDEGNAIERTYGWVEPEHLYGDVERFGWDESSTVTIGESPG